MHFGHVDEGTHLRIQSRAPLPASDGHLRQPISNSHHLPAPVSSSHPQNEATPAIVGDGSPAATGLSPIHLGSRSNSADAPGGKDWHPNPPSSLSGSMDVEYGEEGMPLTDDEGNRSSNVSFDVGLSLIDDGLGMEFGAVGGPGTNRARQGSGHQMNNGSGLSGYAYTSVGPTSGSNISNLSSHGGSGISGMLSGSGLSNMGSGTQLGSEEQATS